MRKFYAEFFFWLHLVIVLFWCTLFFVSTKWWPDKVSFHFYLSLVIVGHQFLWGAIIMPWTRRYRTACMLTTIMQILRGHNVSDKRNYEHSFTKELFERIGIKIPLKVVTILTFTIMIIVMIQYFSL